MVPFRRLRNVHYMHKRHIYHLLIYLGLLLEKFPNETVAKSKVQLGTLQIALKLVQARYNLLYHKKPPTNYRETLKHAETKDFDWLFNKTTHELIAAFTWMVQPEKNGARFGGNPWSTLYYAFLDKGMTNNPGALTFKLDDMRLENATVEDLQDLLNRAWARKYKKRNKLVWWDCPDCDDGGDYRSLPTLRVDDDPDDDWYFLETG